MKLIKNFYYVFVSIASIVLLVCLPAFKIATNFLDIKSMIPLMTFICVYSCFILLFFYLLVVGLRFISDLLKIFIILIYALFCTYVIFKQKEEIVEKAPKVIEIKKNQDKDYVHSNASWYGEHFNGKKTASGTIYNENEFTCASYNLPFGQKLLVTNLENNESVVVEVTDRGPFKMDEKGKVLYPLQPHPSRKLDLSKSAFSKIADTDKGIVKIKYKTID